MTMLIESFFSICLGDVVSRQNGGGRFIFVSPPFVSLYWSMIALVVFFRFLGESA
jgi:hypothetical protein